MFPYQTNESKLAYGCDCILKKSYTQPVVSRLKPVLMLNTDSSFRGSTGYLSASLCISIRDDSFVRFFKMIPLKYIK